MEALYRLSYVGTQKLHQKQFRNLYNKKIGAGNGIRTRDPQLGRLMLYQLSYSRTLKIFGGEGRIRTSEGLAVRFTV